MRRPFLLLLFVFPVTVPALCQTDGEPAGFETIDRAFVRFIEANRVPGGAIAIAKNGRLVLTRGYGLANVEAGEPVRPESLFRTASTGKTITAIAVMKLVETGQLDPDARVFDILSHIRPRSGRMGDDRLRRITVRNLLEHTGGWDATISGETLIGDTMLPISKKIGVPYPVPCETLIAYVLDRRLDFEPGSRWGYSNFGYCVLGRVIEAVSGRFYGDFVRSEILEPLGITRMRFGRSLLANRAPDEVCYYDYPGAPLAPMIVPGTYGMAPRPYSGMLPFESLDSVGGWIASAADLARVYVMLDRQREPFLLTAKTVRDMLAPPSFLTGFVQSHRPGGPPGVSYMASGIMVDRTGTDDHWWHSGSCPGTRAHVERMPGGWVWAALFNSAPRAPESSPTFDEQLRGIFTPAALQAVEWPDTDLFPADGKSRHEYDRR